MTTPRAEIEAALEAIAGLGSPGTRGESEEQAAARWQAWERHDGYFADDFVGRIRAALGEGEGA
jgi:hypothetical protein